MNNFKAKVTIENKFQMPTSSPLLEEENNIGDIDVAMLSSIFDEWEDI